MKRRPVPSYYRAIPTASERYNLKKADAVTGLEGLGGLFDNIFKPLKKGVATAIATPIAKLTGANKAQLTASLMKVKTVLPTAKIAQQAVTNLVSGKRIVQTNLVTTPAEPALPTTPESIVSYEETVPEQGSVVEGASNLLKRETVVGGVSIPVVPVLLGTVVILGLLFMKRPAPQA